ncbi:MAG: hypothetical protein J6S21_03110 [Victivallales bacterium]|nr:hypothetical protein [Victivallales bacterium]
MATEYTKILWMELIGLDNTQPDMGVSEYLRNLGFTPDFISIFMWDPDFVNLHDGLEKDELFPPDIGAYLDIHYTGYKQSGPPWSKFQLKQVVDELHKRGVRVLFSIFPLSLGNRFHPNWMNANPESNYVCLKKFQAPSHLPVLNPHRRLADGSWYEDFLISQALRVTVDYGFDGWHLADGINRSWFQIDQGDFSDDMVDQFLTDTGIEDEAIQKVCGDDWDAIDARGKYIWKAHRKAWILFYCRRNRRYLTKITSAFHKIDKLVTANTCCTRDPLEAIYRFGKNYRELHEAGIDAMVVETCSAAMEMMKGLEDCDWYAPAFSVLQATAILTRAMAPKARILFNNCTQDITEGWSVLHHCPTFLEKEVSIYTTLAMMGEGGSCRRVFDGMQVCLAADMESHEWHWLKKKWDIGYGADVKKPGGLLLVWSDRIIAGELDALLAERCACTAPVLADLLTAGVQVQSCVSIEDAPDAGMPLLLINPGLLPREEVETLLAKTSVPVVFFGRLTDGRDGIEIRNWQGELPELPEFYLDPVPEEPLAFEEPILFNKTMYYRRVNGDFCRIAARTLAEVAPPVFTLMADTPLNRDFHFNELVLENGKHRVLVCNSNWLYIGNTLVSSRKIASVEVVNEFQGRPITVYPRTDGQEGSLFFLRVPPKGVAIIDVTFA